MVAASEHYYMTPSEYLDWEEGQEIKYEYFDGEVVAMTGGTIAHGIVTANLFYRLRSYLEGKSCVPFIFDVKLGVSNQGLFHYPDLMVSCHPLDLQERQVIYRPCLIIEVLSPSTEAFDRGRKFYNYRQIKTLQEYVLVSVEAQMIECFRLNEKGLWELSTYTEKDELELTSIGFNLTLDLVYENINFNP